jgi:hypothetical protein
MMGNAIKYTPAGGDVWVTGTATSRISWWRSVGLLLTRHCPHWWWGLIFAALWLKPRPVVC